MAVKEARRLGAVRAAVRKEITNRDGAQRKRTEAAHEGVPTRPPTAGPTTQGRVGILA